MVSLRDWLWLQAQGVLQTASSLTTFDLSASSANRFIWETVPRYDRCGTAETPLRDTDGHLQCRPHVAKPRYCHIDEACVFTLSLVDEYGVTSRIGGVRNLTVMPMETAAATNVSIWPIHLKDDRDGGYTATIPAHEMLAKGMHRFRLFKDGDEFWAPQDTENVRLCDTDDTPAYPNCPLELDFQGRHCGAGSHPDAINGTLCLCDEVDGVPLGRVSEDMCAKNCDTETSVASADHLRCDCKDGFYDTSKVGLVVCFEEIFNLKRASMARKRQHAAQDTQCLPCLSCLDSCSYATAPAEMVGVPAVKSRHRMNFSSHRTVTWSMHASNATREKYVYDCAGESKTGGSSDIRQEVCPSFRLNDLSNMSCQLNHTGPLCESCAEKYTLDQSGKCKHCESLGDLWWLLIVSLVFVAVVPVLFGLAQTMHVDEKLYTWLQAKLTAKLGRSAEKYDVKETAHAMRDIRHLSHFFETTKITISFGQVAALLPGVLGIPEFDLHLPGFHLPGFGLDIRGTLECFIYQLETNAADEGGMNKPAQIYFDAWLLHVIGLPMLMFTPVALFMSYMALRRRCTARAAPEAGGTEEEIGVKLRAHGFFCIFLLYPSQTEAIFKLFECRSLGYDDPESVGYDERREHCNTCDFSAGECNDCPEKWLGDDMRVSCNGHLYQSYYRLAQVLIVVVALGFPLLVWMTLYRAQTKENEARERAWEAEYDEDTDDLASIRSSMRTITRDEQMMKFAYTGHYHTQFYYWEPLDMIRKLMLTGLITFLGKGTVSQLFVAILVTFFFFCLHIACAPYRQSEDNVLKGCADLELFFVMLVTLVKKLGNEDEDLAHGPYRNETVPDAFIGDNLQPTDYDKMIVFSFFVNVVAAYICVVLYKLGNLGLVVNYRKRRSWRQASKDATAQLFDGSGMLSSDRDEFEMTLDPAWNDGLGSGLLMQQHSVSIKPTLVGMKSITLDLYGTEFVLLWCRLRRRCLLLRRGCAG